MDCMSIMFTVLSYDPVARYLPSAEKATLFTSPILKQKKIKEINEMQ